jgi:hypothetical protein
LVAIVKKRLALAASLYEILQIFSLTLFEKTPVTSNRSGSSNHGEWSIVTLCGQPTRKRQLLGSGSAAKGRASHIDPLEFLVGFVPAKYCFTQAGRT